MANIRHHQTKDSLPLFFVDLESADNNRAIYDLRSLPNQRIKVESPRPRKDVIQCQHCKQFGHTSTYCTQPPICVKCGQEHETGDCTKPRDTSPKCGLCEGEHTANYRGCPEYLKLKRGHLKSITRSNSNDRMKLSHHQTIDESNANLGNDKQTAWSANTVTYAQMACSRPSAQSIIDPTRTEQLLVKMCGQFETMCQQMQNMFEQNKQPDTLGPAQINQKNCTMNVPTRNKLSQTTCIMAWNSNGLLARKLELTEFLETEKVDIALISETHLTSRNKVDIRGYDFYQFNHLSGASHGGSAIYLKNTLRHHACQNFCTDKIQATIIKVCLHNGSYAKISAIPT